jgi:hypothetical protein
MRGLLQVTFDIHCRVKYAKYLNALLGLHKIRNPVMAIHDYPYFPIRNRFVSLAQSRMFSQQLDLVVYANRDTVSGAWSIRSNVVTNFFEATGGL